MKAIILSAGQGSRLRPLTNDRPKGLVNIRGESIIERQVRTYKNSNITDVRIVTGYKSESLAKVPFKKVHNSLFLETNMVYSLFLALKEITNSSDVIFSYGDIIFEDRILSALKESAASFTTVTDKCWLNYWKARMEDPLSDAETLRLDGHGRILEVGKKATSYSDIEGQYIGLTMVRKSFLPTFMEECELAFTESPTGKNISMTDFFQRMIDRGIMITSCQTCNGWMEFDALDDKELAEHSNQFFNF